MHIFLSYYLLIVYVCNYVVFASVIGEASPGMQQVTCQNIVRKGELRLDNKCLSNTLRKTHCTGSADQEFLICGDDQTVRQVKENQCITRDNDNIVLRKCSLITPDENQRWEKEEKNEADAATLFWEIGGVKQNNFFLKQGEDCITAELGVATGNVLVKTCGSAGRSNTFRFNNRGTIRKRGQIKYQGNNKCITAATGKLFEYILAEKSFFYTSSF